MNNTDTIIALATPQGVGAISVIRLSGKESIAITNKVFKGKDLEQQPSHTIHFGIIHEEGKTIDEVLVSLFIAPNSFTKEDSVEISCHGSQYIVQQIIQLFINKGVRLAKAGEFTKRAFLNGRFDLAQAEAVADLIVADSEAAHRAALHQMRGGFSAEIKKLREKLIHFASMIELELDFSEEDVAFANRDDLRGLINELLVVIRQLISSFEVGNVIKNGVPTVIAGKPNAGKSTLLNALLNEEKAIVSEIPGTTRDFIEDELIMGGVTFRFIDTAGLREAEDSIEAMGIKRTKEKMQSASLIIYLFDVCTTVIAELHQQIDELENLQIPFLLVGNKIDQCTSEIYEKFSKMWDIIFISAHHKEGIEALKAKLLEFINLKNFKTGNTIVTNARHYESLMQTYNSLNDVLNSLNQDVTGDFLAMDIRRALHYLGEITGEITTEDLLGNIFSKFCIGK